MSHKFHLSLNVYFIAPRISFQLFSLRIFFASLIFEMLFLFIFKAYCWLHSSFFHYMYFVDWNIAVNGRAINAICCFQFQQQFQVFSAFCSKLVFPFWKKKKKLKLNFLFPFLFLASALKQRLYFYSELLRWTRRMSKKEKKKTKENNKNRRRR